MFLPICKKEEFPRTAHGLAVKDEYLARVLAGEEFLLFDGALGTMFQREGLAAGALSELLNLSDPAAVTAIHRAYVEAGAQVVTTNTFGANGRKLAGKATVQEVFFAAVENARAAGPRYVAADIGPTGALLKPLGTLAFDEAYELFAEQVRAAEAAGADLIAIETMTDLAEMKAAFFAAKEQTRLPVFATMTFGEDGRTFLGTSPCIAARCLEAWGADALGINCSLGPAEIAPLVDSMLAVTSRPLIVQANAGLPQAAAGTASYSLDAEAFCEGVLPLIEAGVSIVGGCCGTDPSYIEALAELLEGRVPCPRTSVQLPAVTSAQVYLELGEGEVYVIGERLNPTGRKRIQEAIRCGDFNAIAQEAIDQDRAGADILDVNVGLPGIDEPAILSSFGERLQGVTTCPLQFDSSDPRAIEAAVRSYAGIPLINSVNASAESLAAVLPIAAHYGCAVLGLTLDEGGIPPRAEERLALARRILQTAQGYGIPSCQVLIDSLVMAAATNPAEARETLRATALISDQLGLRTVLGVSNVSFGLPGRRSFNATYLAAALASGLNLPIMDPLDEAMVSSVRTWRVLTGQDQDAKSYISSSQKQPPSLAPSTLGQQGEVSPAAALFDAVVAGKRGVASTLVGQVDAPLPLIEEALIPALDEVGRRYEEGSYFLPQLMASAEAAKEAFDELRRLGGPEPSPEKREDGPIVLATVKGDIHDIGKNIAAMLLENYGYRIIDLGRDVEPEAILQAVRENGALAVGLSALMTTTLPAMERTVALLRQELPQVKVFVGGAVLTPEYARSLGADFHAPDAASTPKLLAQALEG